MKIILYIFTLALLGLGFTLPSLADETPAMHSKTMYFNFGMGVGTAKDWNTNSLALNAMTMGAYLNPNLGVEIGMDSMPNGGNEAGQAMIMSYHLAAKGVLPVYKFISLYGKLGLGVNGNEGEAKVPASSGIGHMGMKMDNSSSIGLFIAAGTQFNLNSTFALYVEGSGIYIPKDLDTIGRDSNNPCKGFGSSYMLTTGLEFKTIRA